MSDADTDPRLVGARVAGHAILREIRTFSISARLDRLPAGDVGLSYEFEPTLEHEQLNDSILVIDGQYRLSISEHPDGDDGDTGAEEKPLAEIGFTLSSLYALHDFEEPDSPPFSEQELRAFTTSTGQFALYPYVRALVSDLVGRLGLPTLTLPMLKVDITDEIRKPGEGADLSDGSELKEEESSREAVPC